MAKASKELILELEAVVNGVADGLPKLKAKRMFGCHAVFANDAVFGLVWKEGRIGVRLPDAEKFDALMDLKGSVPWKAGNMTMSHWVLVPASMHEDKRALKKWLQVAHDLALHVPAKPAKKAVAKKKVTKKKATKKKP